MLSIRYSVEDPKHISTHGNEKNYVRNFSDILHKNGMFYRLHSKLVLIIDQFKQR